MTKRCLTGIKPTGKPHIGNLISIFNPIFQRISKDTKIYCLIADLHAMTNVQYNNDNTMEMCNIFSVLREKYPNLVIYRQSEIPSIPSLYWTLACLTAKGHMNRSHAYKAIVEENTENNRSVDTGVNMGLFTYPILMSADIFSIQPQEVVVGPDQLQHIEIYNDIIDKINSVSKHKHDIPYTKELSSNFCLPGKDGRKMSKSYNNTIAYDAPEKEIKKWIFSIPTNSKNVGEPKYKDESDVVSIYKYVSSYEDYTNLLDDMEKGIGWGEVKSQTLEKVMEFLKPFREVSGKKTYIEYYKLGKDEQEVREMSMHYMNTLMLNVWGN